MMKIPKNMSREETLQIINKVIDKIAPKYTFNGYTIDDVKQEAYIICIKALERYNSEHPLQNFLSVNLSNRMKNLVRDKHINKKTDDDKRRVLSPAQLEMDNTIIDPHSLEDTTDERLDYYEMIQTLKRELPPQYRIDYFNIIYGKAVPANRRASVLNKVIDILEDHGYQLGDINGEDIYG